MRRVGSLLAVEGVLVATLVGAKEAIDRHGPGAWGWDSLARWYLDASADSLGVTAVLAVASVIASWLVVAAALQLLAELVPVASLQGVADRVAPVALRSVGRRVADVALGATVLFAPMPNALPVGPSATVVSDDLTGTATLRPIAPDLDDAMPEPEPEPVAVAPADPVEVPAATEVVVVTGDSFWSIADGLVSGRLGRPATDEETAALWHRLMARNADRLVVPGNFDLIFPGQVLAVPELAPPGSRVWLADTA